MNSKFCFMHIPKTAGKWFLSAIHKHLTPGQFAQFYGAENCSLRAWNALSPTSRQSIRFISGHLGLRDCCQFDGFKLISFVRDPLRRLVSDYFHSTLRFDGRNFWRHSNSPLNFRDFCLSPEFPENSNALTRAFLEEQPKQIGSREIKLARKTILNHFAFVGITEHLAESMRRLSPLLGVHFNPPSADKVVNSGANRDFEISEQDLNDVRAANAPDYELIEFILEHFLSKQQDSDGSLDAPVPPSTHQGLPQIQPLHSGSQPSVIFAIDSVLYSPGNISIGGWCFESASGLAPAFVYLRSNDRVLAHNICTMERVDVRKAYPNFLPNASESFFGYTLEIPLQLFLEHQHNTFIGFVAADYSCRWERQVQLAS
ncbi:MAG: sulfotransferase family protein [Oligoflexia bacterium]|nr:sulfotransferase family protein [Oligoflexia bacterium]